MNPFKQIKDWFAFPQKQKDLAAIIAYIRVGALEDLLAYQKEFLPYRSDTDTGKPDGKYQNFKEYIGAELMILSGGGDCEDIAAFFSEVIRWWVGWESWHVRFVFLDQMDGGKMKAHDVAFFVTDKNQMGWIDGAIYYGGYEAFRQHYNLIGWKIQDWWIANDAGERL
jgi:hypothetical protein